MPTAPWLMPPNYLAAMQAGAGLGLQLRQQREAEINAAQRLRLAQDELLARTLREREENAARMALASQDNALRVAQMQRASEAANRDAMMERARLGLATGREMREQSLFNQEAQFAQAARAGVPASQLLRFAPQDQIASILNQQQAKEVAGQVGRERAKLASLMSLQNQTGIDVVDPETGNVNPTNFQKALEKKQELNLLRATPAAVKTSDAIIAAMEEETGEKLSEADKAKTQQMLLTSGNRTPTLDTDTRSRINVAEYGLSATDQLIKAIEQNPKVRFGPGLFRLDVATGKWTGNDPEAAKIAQLYSQLYAGQAFAQGGKALTKNEVQLIRDQIGDPTDATFLANLKQAERKYTQDLGLVTRQLQDRGFDSFPSYRKWLDRLSKQYEAGVKRSGVSGSFAAPEGGGGGRRLTPEQREKALQRINELLAK